MHKLVNKDFDSIKMHGTILKNKIGGTYFIHSHLSVLLLKFECYFNSRARNTLDTIIYTQGTQGLKHVRDLPHAGISLHLIIVQFTDCML